MNNELYHHGVPGMKWGVRRAEKRQARLERRHSRMSEDARQTSEIKRKKVKEMSNQELQALNKRQELENKHRQLNPNIMKKAVVSVAATAVMTSSVLTLINNTEKLKPYAKKALNALEKVGIAVLNKAIKF